MGRRSKIERRRRCKSDSVARKRLNYVGHQWSETVPLLNGKIKRKDH